MIFPSNPEIGASFSHTSFQDCDSLYGCAISLHNKAYFLEEVNRLSAEDYGNPNSPTSQTIQEKLKAEMVSRFNDTRNQVFKENELYFIFEGNLEIHNDQIQKFSPVYNENWTSYADVWEYNKPSKIKVFNQPFFGMITIYNKSKSDFDVKVRVLRSGLLKETFNPLSTLFVLRKKEHSYNLNKITKWKDISVQLSESNGEVEIETQNPCYLILLTPK